MLLNHVDVKKSPEDLKYEEVNQKIGKKQHEEQMLEKMRRDEEGVFGDKSCKYGYVCDKEEKKKIEEGKEPEK